jgi:hypothetical protein
MNWMKWLNRLAIALTFWAVCAGSLTFVDPTGASFACLVCSAGYVVLIVVLNILRWIKRLAEGRNAPSTPPGV